MMRPLHERYTYRVHFSQDDECYIATVAEMPSLSWADDTQTTALSGIITLVDQIVQDMGETGEEAPLPLQEREYSGKFQVRLVPELHRRLALEAAEQDVSLNRLVSARLTSA